jgi:hypothetical protein
MWSGHSERYVRVHRFRLAVWLSGCPVVRARLWSVCRSRTLTRLCLQVAVDERCKCKPHTQELENAYVAEHGKSSGGGILGGCALQ